jgi:prepilin-type N-terminal cleavage/methylation domain-containing protein
MSGNARYPSRRTEDGWTLMEVLVAMAVLSLLALGAWNAAAVSLRLASGIRERTLEASRLLELDDRLRALASRVRTPYWAGGHGVSLADGGCRVAWLDGDPQKGLLMAFRDGVLTVGDGETAASYPGFRRAAFLSALDAEGRPYGVSVDLETEGGRALAVTGRFGGAPVRGGAPE